MFSRWPSVCLSVCPSARVSVVCTSVRPHFVSVRNLSIYKRISFKFCICICFKNVSLGIVNGQISIIHHIVMALVNGQKWFLASSSFIIWSIIMKLHKNDLSNKSFLLA